MSSIAKVAREAVSKPCALRGAARPEKVEPKLRVLPLTLFCGAATSEGSALSKTGAPFSRPIPCETVITIKSSKLDTPVISLLMEDVSQNGELVIPAGAEVHGRASINRARERIAVSGKWVLVWLDGGPLNGIELVMNGIALDRAKDDTIGGFGLRDGSAGLLGRLSKTDDWRELKSVLIQDAWFFFFTWALFFAALRWRENTPAAGAYGVPLFAEALGRMLHGPSKLSGI